MGLVYDPITVLNLTFDLIILALGAVAYFKAKTGVGGLIGLGFAFFAASYILTILGYGSATLLLLPLRVIGYASVIAALGLLLYQLWPRAKSGTVAAGSRPAPPA